MAGSFFVIPSIFILFGLSLVYAVYGNIPWIAAVFSGLKPAVLAIVAAAVIKIAQKALKNEALIALAAVSFVTIFFFKVPFPLIILGAGLLGLLGGKSVPKNSKSSRRRTVIRRRPMSNTVKRISPAISSLPRNAVFP